MLLAVNLAVPVLAVPHNAMLRAPRPFLAQFFRNFFHPAKPVRNIPSLGHGFSSSNNDGESSKTFFALGLYFTSGLKASISLNRNSLQLFVRLAELSLISFCFFSHHAVSSSCATQCAQYRQYCLCSMFLLRVNIPRFCAFRCLSSVGSDLSRRHHSRRESMRPYPPWSSLTLAARPKARLGCSPSL